MRLFIAIRLPANIQKSLQQTMTDLRHLGVRGNFSRVENLHLTLAFLGEVQNPKPVCEAINAAAAAPFTLELIQIPVHPGSFTVSKISLMKSERINGKLIYSEIYAVSLNSASHDEPHSIQNRQERKPL